MIKFKSKGRDYYINNNGVVCQADAKPFNYDAAYSAIYDSPEYERQSELLQALRLGFVIGALGHKPSTLQDNGYGNGAFLKFAERAGIHVYGMDVTGVKIEGIETGIKSITAEVYTYWDCLEHIHDLEFLKDAECACICVSLPYFSGDLTEFETWHHHKPDEHVRYFDEKSLAATMKQYGWGQVVAFSNHEDIIRKRGFTWNILSMAFKR